MSASLALSFGPVVFEHGCHVVRQAAAAGEPSGFAVFEGEGVSLALDVRGLFLHPAAGSTSVSRGLYRDARAQTVSLAAEAARVAAPRRR